MAARLGPKKGHCTICRHPDRPQIDLAVAVGCPQTQVALRYEVSSDALWRHAKSHLSPEVKAALATKILAREGDMRRVLLEEGAGIVDALKAVRGPLFGLYLAAIDVGDSNSAAKLAGRLHESLSLSAKVTGE